MVNCSRKYGFGYVYVIERINEKTRPPTVCEYVITAEPLPYIDEQLRNVPAVVVSLHNVAEPVKLPIVISLNVVLPIILEGHDAKIVRNDVADPGLAASVPPPIDNATP
jgi:hypothetical protein